MLTERTTTLFVSIFYFQKCQTRDYNMDCDFLSQLCYIMIYLIENILLLSIYEKLQVLSLCLKSGGFNAYSISLSTF